MTWRAWLGFLSFLFSLLAVFRAFANPLWILALGITEWPHWAALICTLPWWLHRPTTKGEILGLLFSAMAVLLCVSPLWRMQPVIKTLPDGLRAAFGPAQPRANAGAPYRRSPFSWTDLFRGITSPAVRVDTFPFASFPEPLSLDLYRPFQANEAYPLVIVIHGGSWKSGTRKEFTPLNEYLAARGYAVASIDYRLAPNTAFPGQRQDVNAAIHFLTEHAKDLGVDPSRIVLLGRSAGGQIALWSAYQGSTDVIRGVISVYAPADMEFAYSKPGNPLVINSRQILEDYMGGPPSRFPDGYRRASAVVAAGAASPPTLLIHGLRDELVWPNHAFHLSARLKELGRPYYFLALPWATHGCDYHFDGPSGQIMTYAIEQFLAVVTKQGGLTP